MKTKFIIKLVIFVVIMGLLDRGFGYLIRTQRPIDYKLFLESKIAFFEDTNQFDILLIGDSHILDAIDPRTIEAHTNFSAFNLGIYHSSPIENFFVTKAAIEKSDKKPKAIVLGTNPAMFELNLSKGKYTPLILPLANTFQLVRNSDEGFDIDYFFQTINEKYLFTSAFKTLIGVDYVPIRNVEDVYNGHLKFFNQIPGTEWHQFEKSRESLIKTEQVAYFRKTIELALANNIQVVLVHPPIWKDDLDAAYSTASYQDFVKAIKEITIFYKLPTYNDYLGKEDSIGSNHYPKDYFLNTRHLNYKGSKLFTEGFAAYLSNILQ